MPRFFFNVRTSSAFYADDEGVELSGSDKIEREAWEAARVLAKEDDFHPDGQHFEIKDEAGRIVLIYPFKDAFDAP